MSRQGQNEISQKIRKENFHYELDKVSLDNGILTLGFSVNYYGKKDMVYINTDWLCMEPWYNPYTEEEFKEIKGFLSKTQEMKEMSQYLFEGILSETFQIKIEAEKFNF